VILLQSCRSGFPNGVILTSCGYFCIVEHAHERKSSSDYFGKFTRVYVAFNYIFSKEFHQAAAAKIGRKLDFPLTYVAQKI